MEIDKSIRYRVNASKIERLKARVKELEKEKKQWKSNIKNELV